MKPELDELDLDEADRLIADELMERFVAGDDTAMPDRFMNLTYAHDVAMAKASRYAMWGHRCSVMLGELAQCSTSAVPK